MKSYGKIGAEEISLKWDKKPGLRETDQGGKRQTSFTVTYSCQRNFQTRQPLPVKSTDWIRLECEQETSLMGRAGVSRCTAVSWCFLPEKQSIPQGVLIYHIPNQVSEVLKYSWRKSSISYTMAEIKWTAGNVLWKIVPGEVESADEIFNKNPSP